MPDLTPQDRESYQKLYSAATDLDGKISKAKVVATDLATKQRSEAGLSFLKGLTGKFVKALLNPQDLSNFDQLQAQVELTGSYLILTGYLTMDQLIAEIYKLVAEAIDQSDQKDDINKASQELLMQYNQLKVLLEAIDDDFLDGVTTPHSDPLFLGLLADSKESKVKSWTQQILSDRSPVLTDNQVQNLTDAWGAAVTAFIEDARKQGDKVAPGESKTIAHFFCIHDQLDGLYSELSTSVALNS